MATPFTERTAWARNVAAPVRDFLNTESSGAMVLLLAAVAALVWSNSPWSESYESFWSTDVSIRVGAEGISLELREWVSEGLMTLFFLVVGLEARRELDTGAFRERRRITISLFAAIGGMAAAVLIYLAINAGGEGAHGWGVAMSTDTAFALGVLALVASGATQLRLRLLTAVVIDDLVALLVIATVYTESVDAVALAIAVALFLLLLGLRFVPMGWRTPPAVLLGVGLWVALHESGIDPLISGLAIGLAISAYPPSRGDLERVTELTRTFREQPTPEMARSAALGVTSAISANERLQYRLHPWTSFVIAPLFALANAGIHVDGDLVADAVTSPITLGIVFGYVLGKPIGISVAAWLATRVTGLRPALSWPMILGNGVVAGIGFTVSLLIAGIAFEGPELEEAKIGVLAAATLAAVLSWIAFRLIERLPAERRASQLLGTAEELLDEFGDELRYVWRHLPLSDVHLNAQIAAEATEAAAAQGAFWPMHDKLLATQDELMPEDLRDHAEALGLDADRFWDELRRREYTERVAQDVASADESGVAGTPSFFINGVRHQGAYDVATLSAAVRSAREKARLWEKARATAA